MSPVTPAEFAEIVSQVANENSRVVRAEVSGYSVNVRFTSNKRKISWSTTIQFNEATAHATLETLRPHSNQPIFFAEAVQERMREVLAR